MPQMNLDRYNLMVRKEEMMPDALADFDCLTNDNSDECVSSDKLFVRFVAL